FRVIMDTWRKEFEDLGDALDFIKHNATPNHSHITIRKIMGRGIYELDHPEAKYTERITQRDMPVPETSPLHTQLNSEE
ncbi:hypothetical protein DRO91_10130, partial [Candidatus Heimdallarchaeota archaeon]